MKRAATSSRGSGTDRTLAANSSGLARSLAIAVCAFVFLGSTATPAAAHGRGADATSFDSRIVQTVPIDGVTWEVIGGDEMLAVTNTSGRELVVLGYDNEPFLRLGPDGVFENRRSPSTYRSRTAADDAPIPADADPDADPDWVRVTDGDAYSWFDHRIHWDAPELPDEVREEPNRTHVVNEWDVGFEFGNAQLPVFGELRWVPGPSPWPWLGGALLVSVMTLVLALRTRPLDDRWRGAARPVSALLVLAAGLNLVYVLDALVLVAPGRGPDIGGLALTAVIVVGALVGGVRGMRGDGDGFLALEIASLVLCVGQGLALRQALGAGILSSLAPDPYLRFTVALSIVQPLAVVTVAEIAKRRLYARGGTHGQGLSEGTGHET